MDDSGISRLKFSALIYMGDSGYSPYTWILLVKYVVTDQVHVALDFVSLKI
jgi:hypothetical protein